ncbi:hypothetical protein [Actinacidiphila glaucinigra]|uniref:hypothetical protein n=1 Tax=Actinacidiphila glaucinigra TaxID=235986 RepID=UPI00371C0AC8
MDAATDWFCNRKSEALCPLGVYFTHLPSALTCANLDIGERPRGRWRHLEDPVRRQSLNISAQEFNNVARESNNSDKLLDWLLIHGDRAAEGGEGGLAVRVASVVAVGDQKGSSAVMSGAYDLQELRVMGADCWDTAPGEFPGLSCRLLDEAGRQLHCDDGGGVGLD